MKIRVITALLFIALARLTVPSELKIGMLAQRGADTVLHGLLRHGSKFVDALDRGPIEEFCKFLKVPPFKK